MFNFQAFKNSPLARQIPYLPFLGFGIWWAWIWLCYNSTELMQLFDVGVQSGYVLQMYIISTIAIGTSMFVAAGFSKRIASLIEKKSFVLAGGALACASTILVCFAGSLNNTVLFFIGSALTGIGTSVLCLKAGKLYSLIPLEESLTAGAVSLLLAAFLYFTGIGIPAAARPYFISVLPLLSAFLLSLALENTAFDTKGKTLPQPEVQMNKKVRAMFIKLAAASGLVAFTAGVGKGIVSVMGNSTYFGFSGSITTFFVALLAIAILLIINAGDSVRGARRTYSLLIVLGIAMMLATCFGFNIAYLSIGKECVWMVFSCLMVYIAFQYNLSAVRVFGVGQGVYFFASAIGWFVGSAIQPYYNTMTAHVGVGIGLAFIVVVVFVYIFPENDIKRIMAQSVDAERGNAHSSSADEANACQGSNASQSNQASGSVNFAPANTNNNQKTLPNSATENTTAENANQYKNNPADPKYGLSARELEVLELFAQGRSAAWIAQYFTLSKNTVRTHLRAIYSKLNVHSRQELLDFLGKE